MIPVEKRLSNKGKEELFEAIEEYVDAKIDIRTLSIRPHLNQEQVEERISKARKDLHAKIMALKIGVEYE